MPNFQSEAEEAAWYTTPEGKRQTEREFRKALKSGTIVRSKGSAIVQTDHAVLEQLMEQAKEKATKAISIRLPIADIERASAIAERRGVGYQTVLKELIKAGLSKAS
jgi:predicted DNA binding CopG/RHH family protein